MRKMNEELLLNHEQRRWLLEMDSVHSGYAVNIAEIIAKDLEYYINLVDKSALGLERTDSNFERSSTVTNILSNNFACYKTIVHEMKYFLGQTLLLSNVMRVLQPPLAFSNHHSDQSADINIKARPSTSKKIGSY